MASTFGGVTLPNASKLAEDDIIQLRDALLVSGKHRVVTTANKGFSTVVKCCGTFAEKEAVRALIGTSGSLVTPWVTYTKCSISAFTMQESDNPLKFYFDVTFKEDTTT